MRLRPSTKIKLALIALSIPLAIYVVWFFGSLRWIPAGYVGVIYSASRGLEDKVYKPQAIHIGWFQQLYTYPTMIRNAVYPEDQDAGEVKASDGILVTT